MRSSVDKNDMHPDDEPSVSAPAARRRRARARLRRAFAALLAVAAGAALLAAPAAATEVKIFRSATAADFLGGELDGVSVDQLGRLRLAEKVERLTGIGEPFLLSADRLGDGWVVGTGNDGRVLAVRADGSVETLFDAPEPEVFAVRAESDGVVFAATSPNGKVYRIEGGAGEVFFDPQQLYVWDLARAADGRLLVATGTEGRLFAVDAAGEGELIYDSHDTHLRALQPLPDGGVLVGTAGEGLVLRVGPDGKARTLFDAAQPEIVALTAGAEGRHFAVAVASEASQVDLSRSEAQKPEEGGSEEDDEGAESLVDEGFDGVGSRPSSFSGGRSELLSIASDGLVQSLWTFQDETVYSLLWQEGRLWVGTGQQGKLYSWRESDRVMVLEKEVEDKQIVALLPGDEGPALATTNAAALYRSEEGSEQRGTYLSRVLDAGQLSTFGTFAWWGAEPAGSSLELSFRSGISALPDATWSQWIGPQSGREVALGDLPTGRYVQWRAELGAGRGGSPRLDAAELSYRQRNLSPRIAELKVLEPGKILVPSNFNPAQQAFEPVSPSRDGIFTTLEPARSGNGRLKPLWKLGYRALRWKAEDPNGDDLVYRLEFRPAGSDEQQAWLPVAGELDDEYYNFDSTVLPDGVYRFRLVASDAGSNAAGEALAAEQLSEPVIIDHAPPRVLEAKRTAGRLAVRVDDELNPLREAVVSVDAGEWKAVEAADGLIDARREQLLIELPEDSRLLLLRLTDAAHNAVTIDLSEELP